MYTSDKRLVILDADGTTIDAYSAIDKAFSLHGMTLGDEERFQKRRHLFKYLGGLKEFPSNLRKQISKHKRKLLIGTLTEVYREEASLYPGIATLIQTLIDAPDVIIGMVTRNITNEPKETLRILFERHGVDTGAFDFLVHIPLSDEKTSHFKTVRKEFDVNPARSYICGDEHKDYLAGLGAGMHPFIVSYGFEDFRRLTEKFAVPEDVISRSPEELSMRLLHALDVES